MVVGFIGKRMFKSLAGKASKSVRDSGGEAEVELDEAGGVRWYVFNFPPVLKLMHFDPWRDAIPLTCRRTASVVYFGLRLTFLALLFNLAATISLVVGHASPQSHIFLSVMQLVMIGGVSSVLFYHHYRGIAGEIRRSVRIFVVGQTCLFIVMCVFVGVDGTNIHGLSGIGKNSEMPLTYDGFCVAEGSLWGVAALFTFAGIWRALRYPGHAAARRLEESAASAKRKKKIGRAADLTNDL